jgi:hypothetical protein
MAENINTAITVEAWAEITVKQWLEKIKKLGIGDSENSTGQLLRSFYHHVNTSANGNPDYITFAFEYYGRFVDWGVGKGITIETRNMVPTSRKQKPWFSPVFVFNVKRLSEILAEKYAQKAANVIVTNAIKTGEVN